MDLEIAALDQGEVAVASTPRLARALRSIYARRQRQQGLSAWRAPGILHWEGWLDELWRERLRQGKERRLLLSGIQERELWARLIRPQTEGRSLISAGGLAELAQQAYALLCKYDSLEALDAPWPGLDAGSFREWARAFEQECRGQGWLSRARLPLALSRHVAEDADASAPASLPSRLLLFGFDRIAPAEERLLSALETAGCRVERGGALEGREQIPCGDESEKSKSNPGLKGETWAARPPDSPPVESLVEAADEEDEITLCAWWARRALELAASQGQSMRIAVLAPELFRRRGEIDRIFRGILAPGAVAVTAKNHRLPYEFSLGVPLAQTPLARAALLVLRWMDEPLGRDEVGWLALSGFLWREESDWLPISIFDAGLRGTGVLPPEYPLGLYLRQRGWQGGPALLGYRDRLYAAHGEWRQSAARAHGFAAWAEAARRILAAAGWPGAHALDSEGFQLRARFDHLLDAVATLSFDGWPARYAEFLAVLARQMEETIFSPQSHDAPVQILGPLEAAGMEFDEIWFLGASEKAWPAPGRPHPLLPFGLQRERGMPHASPGTDWDLARLVTERIRRSAPRCIFSYPAQEKDGALRPSTVLQPRPSAVSSAQMREALVAPAAGERSGASLHLDPDCASGLVWLQEREAGGAEVLKMQAACPFRAFAHFRLGARPLDRSDWGLDAKDRGTLLHRVLTGIWGEIGNREALVELKREGRLRETVERRVSEEIGRYRSQALSTNAEKPAEGEDRRQDGWSEAYLQAESARVVQLLEGWLDYEAQRAPFSVAAREETVHASAGNLKLNLRLDRVDMLGDGGLLLIDYKTGIVPSSAWQGERPDEPQLPLYATFGAASDLRGVLVGQIRARELKFSGNVELAAMEGFQRLPGSRIEAFTPELRQRWESALLALADGFLEGDARVDPKRYPASCEYCALPGLCRIAESRRAIEVGDGNDED